MIRSATACALVAALAACDEDAGAARTDLTALRAEFARLGAIEDDEAFLEEAVAFGREHGLDFRLVFGTGVPVTGGVLHVPSTDGTRPWRFQRDGASATWDEPPFVRVLTPSGAAPADGSALPDDATVFVAFPPGGDDARAGLLVDVDERLVTFLPRTAP